MRDGEATTRRARARGEDGSIDGGRRAVSERESGLERECDALCRYLLSTEPTDYVAARYVAAHEARRRDLAARSRFDGPCLELAVVGPAAARVADAYARLFAPRGLLRRKLSLLLAIVESSPGLCQRVDAVDPGGRPRLVLGLAVQLGLWLLALAAGVVLLGPVQLIARGPVEPAPEDG